MSNIWIYIIIFFLSFAPVVAAYLWFRLAKYEFSAFWLLIVVLTGAAAFLPALFFQRLLSFSFETISRREIFYHYFIRIAFSEELSRFLVLFLFFRLSGLFRNPADNLMKKGAAAGFVAGLGFAVIENALYGAFDINLILLRLVTASPLHAACGTRIGTAVVMIRSNPVQAVLRIFSAIVIHGIYNLMITMPRNTGIDFPAIAAILLAYSALFTSIQMIRNTNSESVTGGE